MPAAIGIFIYKRERWGELCWTWLDKGAETRPDRDPLLRHLQGWELHGILLRQQGWLDLVARDTWVLILGPVNATFHSKRVCGRDGVKDLEMRPILDLPGAPPGHVKGPYQRVGEGGLTTEEKVMWRDSREAGGGCTSGLDRARGQGPRRGDRSL